jgi:hypothetical protein
MYLKLRDDYKASLEQVSDINYSNISKKEEGSKDDDD